MSNKIIRDNVVQGAIVSREWAEANAIDSTNFNKLYKLVYQPSLTLVDCTPGYTLDDDTSTEIYKVSQFMEDDAGGGGGGASNTSQLSVNDPVSESLGGTSTEQNGVNMEVVTELRSLDTRLDAVETGGGGAVTTDQITTLGISSITADGTPLNDVLSDLYTATVENHGISSQWLPNRQLGTIKKGIMGAVYVDTAFVLGNTPDPGTSIGAIGADYDPYEAHYFQAFSLDNRECVVFCFKYDSSIIFVRHTIDGVDVPPGSSTGELYFTLNYILKFDNIGSFRGEQKPAPELASYNESGESSDKSIKTIKESFIAKVVRLWKTLVQ